MQPLDVLIVGQGLAGTTLAWRLLQRRQRVMVVDPLAGPSASRVAAGLLAPVGGKRLALAWRAPEAWTCAIDFYKQVQQRLDVRLLDQNSIVRLFTDEQQRAEFEARRDGALREMLVPGAPGLDSRDFREELGGFVARGARLDVATYLEASRARFASEGAFQQCVASPEEGFRISDDMVEAPQLSLCARRVVLCCGIRHPSSAGLPPLPFEPAKGEVLTIEAPCLQERRVVQRGVWLAPVGESRFKVGATFHREAVDDAPTAAGREELLTKLQALLNRPFDVVGHTAGMRPVVRGRLPVVGSLPHQPRVGVFNGLGANGTLWAPWVSDVYATHLVEGVPLPADIDLGRRFPA
ncbi:MAG: FAD-binding oxidoreductase [Planctomycetales bacterium]|nr:FAD-binding oxidoreductase [Planctomycetales bacterium]